MKVCVSAVAGGLDAQVDPRFGRCPYFLIVDSETMKFEAVPNTASRSMSGAGIHDLERALQLLNHFNVPPFVCINMYDINRKNAERIIEFCEKNKVEVAGEIPFVPNVTEAMVAGKTIIEYSPKNIVSQKVETVWKTVLSALNEE